MDVAVSWSMVFGKIVTLGRKVSKLKSGDRCPGEKVHEIRLSGEPVSLTSLDTVGHPC